MLIAAQVFFLNDINLSRLNWLAPTQLRNTQTVFSEEKNHEFSVVVSKFS